MDTRKTLDKAARLAEIASDYMNAQTEQGSDRNTSILARMGKLRGVIVSGIVHVREEDAYNMAVDIADDLTQRLQQAEAERATASHNARHYSAQVQGLEEEVDTLRQELNITKATLTSTQARLERVLDRSLDNAIRIAELEGEPTETEITDSE